MKKFLKVLLALVIIAGIAIGAYFIFGNKPNGKLVYSNAYSLQNKVLVNNVNVVENINEFIEDLPDVVSEKQITGIQTELTYFENYERIYESLDFVIEEITENNVFIKLGDKVYVNKASESFEKVKDIYIESYNYLTQTYYSVMNGSYTSDQLKVYIQNFYIKFKDINTNINNFCVNTSIAYSKVLDNTIKTNNLYKLNVEFYGHLMNYLTTNDVLLNDTYFAEVNATEGRINSVNLHEKYFKNKEIIDELFVSSEKLNYSDMVANYLLGKTTEYYNSIQDAKEKELVKNYFNLVMEVNV